MTYEYKATGWMAVAAITYTITTLATWPIAVAAMVIMTMYPKGLFN